MKSNLLLPYRRVIFLCLIWGSVLTALLFTAAQTRLMRVEVLRDYGEGHTMWMSQQITNSEIAYKPLDGLPFAIFPYPPLYLIASKVAGIGSGNLLIAGRGISLASTLLLALLIATLVFKSIPNVFPHQWRVASAALGAALVLTTNSVVGWASLMRVDMFGLMLMYAGMLVYILAGKRERLQYLAIFLFVLAAFAKQTLLSAPMACAIFGLYAYPKTTIRVYGVALLLGLTGILACHWLTNGGFLNNIVRYNLNPFSWYVVLWQLYSYVHLQIILKLLLSTATLLALWHPRGIQRFGWKRFSSIKANQPYSRAIIITGLNTCLAGLMSLSVGKMGSIYNFFLATDISLCLLSALYIFRLMATWRTGSTWRSVVTLALLIILLIPSRQNVSVITENFSDQIKEEAQLTELIRTTPGPVLSDNMLIITQAGRRIEVEPATLSFLTRAGGWDEQPYLHLFNVQYFQLIVTTPLEGASRYSPAVMLAVEKNYKLDNKIGDYLIYRPRHIASMTKK